MCGGVWFGERFGDFDFNRAKCSRQFEIVTSRQNDS
jgi:hypothetical protein